MASRVESAPAAAGEISADFEKIQLMKETASGGHKTTPEGLYLGWPLFCFGLGAWGWVYAF
jgi:hypothetical protein